MLRIPTFILLACAGLSAADAYTIDPVHSTVLFKTSHLGISSTWGRFNTLAGKLTWSDGDPAQNRLQLTVEVASVDTANQKRDQHLQSPDFLNVRQFPQATFTSTAWRKTGERSYEVNGDFSLHGTTRPLTLAATLVGQGATPMKDTRIGLEAQVTIKRSDFGMAGKIDPVTDPVLLVVAIEAIR